MRSESTQGFIARLDEHAQGADQVQAMKFEPVRDQSNELDAAAEVAAFVERSAPACIDAAPAPNHRSRKTECIDSSTRNTPFFEAAGFYGTGQI